MIRANEKTYTIDIVDDNKLMFKCEQDGAFVHHLGKVHQEDSYVTRFEAALKKDQYHMFAALCERVGGKQTRYLLDSTHSMMDRMYGARGLVLALHEYRLTGGADVDNLSLLIAVGDALYSCLTMMTDVAAGFHQSALNSTMQTFATSWLRASQQAGVGKIPPSVHQWAHIPALVSSRGSPFHHAVFLQETGHIAKKRSVVENNNRHAGESGQDFLLQVLRREARQDVLRFALKLDMVKEAERWQEGFQLRAELKPAKIKPEDRLDVLKDSYDKFKEWFPNANAAWELAQELVGEAAVHPYLKLGVRTRGLWAIAQRTQGCWGRQLDKGQFRVLAIAPPLDDAYRAELAAQRQGACADISCLACAPIQYQSTLAANSFPATADRFLAAWGYITEDGNLFAVGIMLEVGGDHNSLVRCAKLPPLLEVIKVPVERIRGEAVCSRVKIGAGQYVVHILQRLRLVLT